MRRIVTKFMHTLFKLIFTGVFIIISLPKLCSTPQPNNSVDFPLITPLAIIKKGRVLLKPVILEDTLHQHLTFKWQASPRNAAAVVIHQHGDGTANVDISDIEGEYYFTLNVIKEKKTEKLETFVTRDERGLIAFDTKFTKAAWINKAIIYQITPYIFVKGGKYPDIEAKLPELKDLGINTILLQPVFKSEKGGQGYDVTDYFTLREDLGSETQLRSLIVAAKSLQLRILFDIVPNHTSINHPYAQDKIANGTTSPYYDFYQQSNDGAPYSSNYHQHPAGFVYYFWKDLVNLNFNNTKVQRLIIDACKYWVRKFDIDGYRFDAVWGVNARSPLFGSLLQLELKSIKPDLFLLAEDKASPGTVYKQGFDAAYDWAKDTGWVSKWSWQYEFDKLDSKTLFNHPLPASRSGMLKQALFNDGDSIGLRLRYLENNDLHRFISNHSLEVTKMAATLLFSLQGVPMLYNGQEIGFKDFPYRSGPVFQRDKSIRSLNPEMFDFYKRLISVRKQYDALISGTIREIPVTGLSGAVAFTRSNARHKIFVIINMAGDSGNVELDFADLKKLSSNNKIFTDVISGHKIIVSRKRRKRVLIPMNRYFTRILLFDKKIPLSKSGNPKRGQISLN